MSKRTPWELNTVITREDICPELTPADIAREIVLSVMAENRPAKGDGWKQKTPEYYEKRASLHLQQKYAEAHGAPQTGEDHLAHALTDLGIAATLRSRATGAAE